MTQNLSLEEKRELSQAFRFMVDAHDHQFRKNAELPCACHPVKTKAFFINNLYS
jgi:(p)ppGpp synthase/HD superfamily hydrolase